MRRWTTAIAVLCTAAGLAASGLWAQTSPAAVGNPIINDCQTHGELTQTYTLQQLRHALAVMPASIKQYTDCYDVIQRALIQARKTGKGGAAPAGSGSGGSFLPTPVIIVLAVLVVAALGFAGMALARRRRPPSSGPPA
ncbi:MAG TPA: hypothetical protein VG325_01735 [Solirubrobacteraceae bacterium]|nr:hypothetical protein [Solirubrobacteraceae bacterium]